MAPAAALAHLKAMLLKHRFEVVAEIGITPRDQDATGTYTLLHAMVPVAVAIDLAADPSVPSSLTIPMSVYPVGDGSQIAITDPFVGVWLFGQPELLKAASKLRERVKEALRRALSASPAGPTAGGVSDELRARSHGAGLRDSAAHREGARAKRTGARHSQRNTCSVMAVATRPTAATISTCITLMPKPFHASTMGITTW